MRHYQSHADDAPGQTDSTRKLARLKLPANLAGKAFLDIGCNEGFFCQVAAERHAARVVGIDSNEAAIDEARRRYTRETIAFLQQDWATLPPGPFDIVVWASAMHYELDPVAILRLIHGALDHDGLLVLECGVLSFPQKQMVYVVRHDGALWYPTGPFLESALLRAGFTFRKVSDEEITGLDPVPRVVYHCRKLWPTVMLISGASGAGKSSLAHITQSVATKRVSLDLFLYRVNKAAWAHTEFQKFVKTTYDHHNLKHLYDGIDAFGFTEEYATLVSWSVAATDELVVIEGYMTAAQTVALEKALSGRARVWTVDRA
jgi:SAM-dependent methyltransferase